MINLLGFTKYLEYVKSLVIDVITVAEKENITNTQVFLDWEDEINKLSIKDHTKSIE